MTAASAADLTKNKKRERPTAPSAASTAGGGDHKEEERDTGTAADDAALHAALLLLAQGGISIGDLMLGKYKSTPGWYECKVVGEAEGGKWVVEWEDGDEEDTLKEPHHLKRRDEVAKNKGGGMGGTSTLAPQSEWQGDTDVQTTAPRRTRAAEQRKRARTTTAKATNEQPSEPDGKAFPVADDLAEIEDDHAAKDVEESQRSRGQDAPASCCMLEHELLGRHLQWHGR
jgi:hypothetical protein